MNEAVAEAHRLRQAAGSTGAGAGPLARALSRAAARVERALAALAEEASGDPEDLRTAAEALLAAAHAIRPGTTEIEVPDPHAGGSRKIRLNPKLGAAANAELYFKRARKAERRAGRSGQRRRQLLDQRRALRDLQARLAAGGEAAADEAWQKEAHEHGVVLPSPPLTEAARSSGGDLPGAVRPRRYDLGGGWTALVGRSSRGNEILTHEIARPDEVWMHADQAAGSHLVLRHAERGRKPPENVVMAAAAIAAWFSKSRHSGKVPVLVTEKRHVRRARRAPIGTVLVGTHRNVMVAPRNPSGEET
jgi:predicted ribosome quality control (RQC) complex YloA/Tae2 family protein